MTTAVDLRTTWAVLRMNMKEAPYVRVALEEKNSYGHFQALLSREKTSLLVPVGQTDVVDEVTEGRVQLRCLRLPGHTQDEYFVEIGCTEVGLVAVFSHLCADLILNLGEAPDPAQAVRAFYDEWKLLFSNLRASRLTIEELRGLYGELVTLGQLKAADKAVTLDCWKGPSGAPHDFMSDVVDIEVKSSQSRNAVLIRVHGIEQLEARQGTQLLLQFHRIDTDISGQSVAEKVEDLISAGISRLMLYDKLLQVGYDVSDDAKYHETRFKLIESRSYLVNESFPRIVRDSFVGSDLPAGVLGVEYIVDLTGPAPLPLAEEQFSVFVRKFLDGAHV